MTGEEVKSLLNRGEGLTVEFKSSFNREVNEPLVPFANTTGGSVLIGVPNGGR